MGGLWGSRLGWTQSIKMFVINYVPKKYVRAQSKKYKNITVEENALTFLVLACFVYHIQSCQDKDRSRLLQGGNMPLEWWED